MDENEQFFSSEYFLTTLWECGNCRKKFTGRSIRDHVLECPVGDTIKWQIMEKFGGYEND